MEIDWREHINSDPSILGGKPAVRGTRISVELVVEYISDGGRVADIIDAYPSVTEADVRAAIAFSNHLMAKEAVSARQEAARGVGLPAHQAVEAS